MMAGIVRKISDHALLRNVQEWTELLAGGGEKEPTSMAQSPREE